MDSSNRIIRSPSGWYYRKSQENGDRVDCQWCGSSLNDDLPIVNDFDGYAHHPECLARAARHLLDIAERVEE